MLGGLGHVRVRDAGAPSPSVRPHAEPRPHAFGDACPADADMDGLYAPRRTVLDPILADAAVQAGAEIVRGPRLVDLQRDKRGRVTGVVIERDGVRHSVGAGIVVGADGVRSTVARLVEPETVRTGDASTGVVYGYWAGFETGGYHWFFRPGVSAGVIPTNGGANVFASVPRERFWDEIRFDLEDGYTRVLEEAAPELNEGLAQTRRLGRLHGYPGHSSYLRQCSGPGWALVGDSAYFKDPLTAHGITDALRDSELLARPSSGERSRPWPNTSRCGISFPSGCSTSPMRWPRSTGMRASCSSCTAT